MNKITETSFFISVLLTGFYGGTGFFTLVGGNPAITRLSDHAFAEYWQSIDHFMAARMKIFGPILILSLLINIGLLSREWQTPAFSLLVLAFLILLGDLVFTLNINHPLNQEIQSWDLSNLPADVQNIKSQVVRAFNIRMLFMIASFIITVLAFWLSHLANRTLIIQ